MGTRNHLQGPYSTFVFLVLLVPALDKLGACRGESRVEPVASNTVFDVASLFLYGCSLIPTPLRVLLDRLFSVLPSEDVLQILRGFGWSLEDYDRGYVRQVSGLIAPAWLMYF